MALLMRVHSAKLWDKCRRKKTGRPRSERKRLPPLTERPASPEDWGVRLSCCLPSFVCCRAIDHSPRASCQPASWHADAQASEMLDWRGLWEEKLTWPGQEPHRLDPLRHAQGDVRQSTVTSSFSSCPSKVIAWRPLVSSTRSLSGNLPSRSASAEGHRSLSDNGWFS